MTCIHGLDEINCPTCRTAKSTFPNKAIRGIKTPNIKIRNPFFNKNDRLGHKLAREINVKRLDIIPPPISPITKPFLINEVPNFENKILLDRFQELDISKEDNFGISKLVPLENPEWKFESEE